MKRYVLSENGQKCTFRYRLRQEFNHNEPKENIHFSKELRKT